MSNLPSCFVARIKGQFVDADAFLRGLETNPRWSVRLHPHREGHDLELANPVPWCDGGYYLNQKPQYTLNPLFHAGNFYPQEASSMFLCHLLENIAGYLPEAPSVLDLSAAPGGKSTLIASWLNGKGMLVSNEVIRSRAWILHENMTKWGFSNVVVTNNDPVDFKPLTGFFDLLVIDAPCSGEGMFRKDMAAADQWSVQNADLCAQRQRRIVMDAWNSLDEDGILVYSTCTFNPGENEENMQWLLTQADAECVRVNVKPEWNITTVGFGGGEGYAFYPHRTEGEGFFVAIFQKKESSGRAVTNRLKKDKNSKNKRQVKLPASLFNNAANLVTVEHQNKLLMMPVSIATAFDTLSSSLNVLNAGIHAGEMVRNEFVPSPFLPFSLDYNRDFYPIADVNREEALRFFKGEWSAAVPSQNGWHVVRYKGSSLGFIKVIGARVNNYYPKEWRIRMNIDNIDIDNR